MAVAWEGPPFPQDSRENGVQEHSNTTITARSSASGGTFDPFLQGALPLDEGRRRSVSSQMAPPHKRHGEALRDGQHHQDEEDDAVLAWFGRLDDDGDAGKVPSSSDATRQGVLRLPPSILLDSDIL